MDGYIKEGLSEFQHIPSKQFQYGPSKLEIPDYGAKIQYVKYNVSALLAPNEIKRIQKVVGEFLFMGRVLDSTVSHALNDIACTVTKSTKATIHAMTCFLNYIASNPLPSIMCRASNMILYVVSDAAYLVSPKVRNRTGGFHYLGSNDGSYTIQCTSICTGNGLKKCQGLSS